MRITTVHFATIASAILNYELTSWFAPVETAASTCSRTSRRLAATSARQADFPRKDSRSRPTNGTAGPRTGSLYHVVDVDEPLVKDGEWFTETIVVQSDTIVVKVNGKQVVNWTQPDDWNGGREGPGRRITGPGTIALQAHDPNSAVLYKNIRIKPLD